MHKGTTATGLIITGLIRINMSILSTDVVIGTGVVEAQMDPGVVTPGGRSVKEIARNIVSSVTGVAGLVTSSPPSTHDTQ